ncbi:hypothetical protein hairong_085 [Pseudomonas phage hairong]|nr:hypothetical protein hairong_085 [Pseudomonas phage hairong]
MNQKRFALSFIAIMGGLTAYGIFADKNSDSAPQDMNDRIIAQTAKCVSAGMEPEIEQRYSSFGSGDEYFVVCKPPGGKGSNLDRMMRQYGEGPSEKFNPPKKQEPVNLDTFEAKSKRTE